MAKKISHKGVILFLVALAQFMVILDVSIVNVALPSIFKALHFSSTSALQWVVTAYTLAFGGCLLLGGRASDLFGRRRIFVTGAALFSIASLACGLSQDSGVLIVSRAVQGLTAAFMSPAALSIILTTFTESRERNRALGVWAAVAAGGATVGVLLGGILTQYLDWRWNFFVNVPVGLFVVIMSLRFIPDNNPNRQHKNLDLAGAVLVTAGLMSLVYGLAKAPTDGWTSETTFSYLGASFIFLVAFINNEIKARDPLLPLSIFRIRNISAANLVQLPVAASLFSMFFFVTLYIQQVLGFSPVKSGLSFLPVTFIIGITSAIISNVVSRTGYKVLLLIGPALLAAGLYMLAHVSYGGTYWGDVFPGLATCALGLGFVFVSITIAATSGVPNEESGLASGLLNTSQQVGGALGLAILAGISSSTAGIYIAEHSSPISVQLKLQAQVAGTQKAFYTGMSFAIAAFVLSLLFIRQKRGEKIQTAIS